MDVTRAEKIFLPVNEKQIIHPYSDQESFTDVTLPFYCLEEVVAEKIRAIGGQRRFAISRDLYDIYNLVLFGINTNLVKQILPEKFAIKGLDLNGIDIKMIEQRWSAFERDWDRRLNYLVINKGLAFDTAWQRVLGLLDEIK